MIISTCHFTCSRASRPSHPTSYLANAPSKRRTSQHYRDAGIEHDFSALQTNMNVQTLYNAAEKLVKPGKDRCSDVVSLNSNQPAYQP